MNGARRVAPFRTQMGRRGEQRRGVRAHAGAPRAYAPGHGVSSERATEVRSRGRTLAEGTAAELVRPLLADGVSMASVRPLGAPGVLTIRASPEQLARAKALLAEHDGASCRVPGAGSR